MAKGSKPKMKLWRREAIKHNEAARETGDFGGHKGRALKTHGFNAAGMPSALFMRMWGGQVATGGIFYHFTPTEQASIDAETVEAAQ